jgi:hypothetical protein
MSRGHAICAILALLTFSLFAAEPPVLRGSLGKEAAEQLGANGARIFRAAEQWNQFQERLTTVGWQKPAENPLANVDFAKNMVVCVFENGDVGNNLAIRSIAGDAKQATVDVAMSYIIYKGKQQAAFAWKFIALTVSQAPEVKISVATYHPMNGGPYPTLEQARPAWSALLGKNAGDLVGNLQGNIEAKAAAVQKGDDIQIQFRLLFADPVIETDARFAAPKKSVAVWDGKYSNGYRNHGFLVKTPDGKTQLLRPKVINNWEKNVPHLVEIAAGKLYVLPAWVEGQNFKSLKELGLDTTQPGTYEITGMYMETGSNEADTSGRTPWGGELYTNTLRVEVK